MKTKMTAKEVEFHHLPEWYRSVVRNSIVRVESVPTWGWEQRIQLDDAEHKERCAHCRAPRKVRTGERLFGLKNRRTRAYVHVIAEDAEDAKEKLGWVGDDIWSWMIEDGCKPKGTMSEETKLRLREYSKNRHKAAIRVDRNPYAKGKRHEHHCPGCGNDYWETRSEDCAPGDKLCMVCEVEPEAGTGGIDTDDAACYNDQVDEDLIQSNKKGGEIEMAETLKEFVRTFIEGQVLVKGEDGKPSLDEKKLFDLAKANNIDASKYRKDFKENAGRIRMTIGNMIRGAASRHGKLVTLGGASKTVPPALLPVKAEKPKAEKKDKTKAA